MNVLELRALLDEQIVKGRDLDEIVVDLGDGETAEIHDVDAYTDPGVIRGQPPNAVWRPLIYINIGR